MIICSPVSSSVKNVIQLKGCLQKPVCSHISVVSRARTSSCCLYFPRRHLKLSYTNPSSSVNGCCGSKNVHSLTVKTVVGYRRFQKTFLDISLGSEKMNLRISVPKHGTAPKVKWNSGLLFGLLVCYSTSEPVHSESPEGKEEMECGSVKYSHGKKVYTDYSITGIPGDGRCLFRSVAHGACLRSGKPTPNESQQRELADELRARVADEFVKRRKETEWFIEGDFDTYVSHIRKPHVWGGEPELLMASHVLRMPITVYMADEDSGGLISIAEYGQEEYGKENPVKVLYHGFGHYDALQILGKKKGERSRL